MRVQEHERVARRVPGAVQPSPDQTRPGVVPCTVYWFVGGVVSELVAKPVGFRFLLRKSSWMMCLNVLNVNNEIPVKYHQLETSALLSIRHFSQCLRAQHYR